VVATEKRGWEVAGCREIEKVRRKEARLLFLGNQKRGITLWLILFHITTISIKCHKGF